MALVCCIGRIWRRGSDGLAGQTARSLSVFLSVCLALSVVAFDYVVVGGKEVSAVLWCRDTFQLKAADYVVHKYVPREFTLQDELSVLPFSVCKRNWNKREDEETLFAT